MRRNPSSLACAIVFKQFLLARALLRNLLSTDFSGKDVFTNGALLAIISKPPSADKEWMIANANRWLAAGE